MKNGAGLPSSRLCPDEDANYRYSVDNIVMAIGEKKEADDYKKREARNRSKGRKR